MTSSTEILFYAELANGRLHRSALELSALSRTLAGELDGVASALLITPAEGQELGAELISYGADKVYMVEDTQFEQYQPEGHALAIERVCRDVDPDVILLGHTLHGVDLAPRLTWRLKAGLATDCVEFRIDRKSKRVSAIRPVYGSKGLAVIRGTRPLIATLRSKAVPTAEKDESRTGEILAVQVVLEPGALRIKYIERVKEETEGPKLEDAEVVVSGGRGLGQKENFAILEELASILGGVVGGSRAAVDNGWLPSSRQVGLTGTMVSPRLYVAIGISGATQHMAGCASSQCIVAINKDPDAPIFQRAHFGVVADYKQVLPKIIDLCKSG
jgi:electron transfer flavoprotein alpha subunit